MEPSDIGIEFESSVSVALMHRFFPINPLISGYIQDTRCSICAFVSANTTPVAANPLRIAAVSASQEDRHSHGKSRQRSNDEGRN